MIDEKFFAWLDGELDPAEAAAMDARVAADPELAKSAEEHRAFSRQLRNAFDPVSQAPVPDALQRSVRPVAEVTDLASWRDRKRSALPHWAAMAAMLAVGIFAGTSMNGGPSGPVELAGGQMVAASALANSLDTQLASAASGDTRIGLTFRDQSGRVCRSFAGPATSGLACRDGGKWQVEGLFAAPEGQDGSYRMATGTDPNLAALIESTIAGEPLDARQEAQAKARGWR